MSYQLQFRGLIAELGKAGIPNEAAVRIAHILGNSAQEMRAGPTKTDTTPRNMRQVNPDQRTHHLTNLDFRQGDPDFRRQRHQTTEEKLRPEPAAAERTDRSTQESDDPFNIAGGKYIDAKESGNGVEIGLKVQGNGFFLGQDSEAGTLVGRNFRAEAEVGYKGLVRFFIEHRGREMLWRLQIDTSRLADFVKDAISSPANNTPPRQPGSPPTIDDALVSVSMTGDGLCFKSLNGKTTCIPVTDCSTG